jgi:hypothetical protein
MHGEAKPESGFAFFYTARMAYRSPGAKRYSSEHPLENPHPPKEMPGNPTYINLECANDSM